MFKTPDISIAVVNKFISDEIHIINKQSANPSATLTFVPIDTQGKRVANAPVAVVELKGEAFNYWYENWTGENDLYTNVLECLKTQKSGFKLTGVDLSKLGSVNNLEVITPQEILAPV